MKNIKSILTVLAVLGITSLSASDGAKTYAKCASCHGQQGELKAMNVSKKLNTLSKSEIVTALKGYKDGTYGGAMKGLMKAQAATLSDEQIEKVASYIGKK
ncbi:MAG: c-type cytochrome [Campylobacterota bacterium]|nr:c-type cytochrome [Campylobacterota bacterium]